MKKCRCNFSTKPRLSSRSIGPTITVANVVKIIYRTTCSSLFPLVLLSWFHQLAKVKTLERFVGSVNLSTWVLQDHKPFILVRLQCTHTHGQSTKGWNQPKHVLSSVKNNCFPPCLGSQKLFISCQRCITLRLAEKKRKSHEKQDNRQSYTTGGGGGKYEFKSRNGTIETFWCACSMLFALSENFQTQMDKLKTRQSQCENGNCGWVNKWALYWDMKRNGIWCWKRFAAVH